MPKRKEEISQTEQSKRFKKAAQDLIDAGELNPTEAEKRFNRAMEKIARPKPSSQDR